jgi:trehalose 6-phosphate phosphatase
MISPTPELPASAALLLDLDGTLLDFAPTPESVIVPAGLAAILLALRKMTGDALAIVTGRPLEQIDGLLPDIPYAVAGEHGGAIRHAPGAPIERPELPPAPAEWRDATEAFVNLHPGLLLESKARGFVVHYRRAPDLGDAVLARLKEITKDGKEGFALLAAQMAWEVKPRGADKGTAVAALMARAPFRGRTPVFIGDDVTDEDGMAAARQLGGLGLRVQDSFVDPAGVRSWLAALATSGGGGH